MIWPWRRKRASEDLPVDVGKTLITATLQDGSTVSRSITGKIFRSPYGTTSHWPSETLALDWLQESRFLQFGQVFIHHTQVVSFTLTTYMHVVEVPPT